jgi:hypothetical protein
MDSGVGSAGDAGGPVDPTFTNVFNMILSQPTCGSASSTGVRCHANPAGGAVTMSGLSFASQSTAYAQLYEVKAMGEYCATPDAGPVLTRVVPGNAQESLLYLKVAEATPPCGATMPKPLPPATTVAPLPQAQVTLIEGWINAGAKND